jgi:outer membrane receptor protein involved in Fe transport
MAHFKKKTLALAIAANLAITGSVIADTALEQTVVVVTGTKINQTEDDTFSSVDVITDTEISAHADANLSDIIKRTPGLYTQSDNEDWGIRGVSINGLNDQGPASASGAISVFVDDAIQMQSLLTSSPISLWDVEQVEVYSGAQSTTQGRNSLAGALVLRSNDPTFDPQFSAQTNMGSYGAKGASLMVNGAILNDTIAGRLSIDSQSSDGYIDNTALNDDANPLKSVNLRGKLLIRPSENTDLLLSFARAKNSGGTNAVSATNGVPNYYKLAENTDTFTDVAQNTATAKLDYYISDELTFTSITSTSRSKLDVLLDFDQNATDTQETPRDQEQKTNSQEFRFAYSNDTIDGVVGAYFSKYEGKLNDQLVFGGFTVLDSQGEIDVENHAVFGEINWRFQDQWKLIAGFRYDNEENNTKINYSTNFTGTAHTNSDTTAKEDVFLPKLGLSYDISEQQTLGLMWKKGYRSGGVNLRALSSHAEYKSEFTTTTELSWRGNWSDNRLVTKANIYNTTWKDQQVSTKDNNNVISVDNAADSQLRGIEVSAKYQATPQLAVFGSAAYNKTEYKNYIQDGNNVSGQDFLFAPEFTATVGADYQVNSKLSIATDVVFLGDSASNYTFTNNQVSGERRNDEVTLVNVNAQYRINKNFRVNGYVKNLFDEEYITNNQADNLLDVGAPMTFGLAVRYDF